jgi:hypothetical protein
MAVETSEVANYTIGGLAAGGGMFWLLRWVIRTFHVDKLAIKSTTAEGNVIDRLESEIHRLEAVINKQQSEINTMNRDQRKLERRLSNQRAVLIAIETIVEGMCTCDLNARKKLAELITELITADTDDVQCDLPAKE